MNYLIVSDIHGSLPRLETVMDHFERENLDMILILGDILNYGPRNGVPEGLDAPGIVSLLNGYADRIVAVRGNCDSEVDQMLLDFPMMQDCAMVADGGVRMLLTHGHIYNEERMPTAGFEVFLQGHTHLWKLYEDIPGRIICNTGSITFPKGGNPPTFATIRDGVLSIRHLDGSVISSRPLPAKPGR